MIRRLSLILATLVVLGIGYALGLSRIEAHAGQEAPPAAAGAPPPVSLAAAPVVAAAGGEAATIALFQAARDSVVAITTAQDVVNPFTRRTSATPLASGSGFIWDDQGHVVTNAHVIANASRATVQLADGRSFDAALVGYDRGHDLAVLRIEGDDLPAAFAPATGTPQVGQSVYAIGNPFGLDWTLTTGIVSALDRDLGNGQGGSVRGLIQTDAAINPGNSGGPLLDSSGRLLGVNTMIYSPSGASAGIGFAVPVATVLRVVPQLIETGRYAGPDLGIVYDARINAAVNRQGLDGVLVLDVVPGTEAAGAGLLAAQMSRDGRIVPGDVIVAVAGDEVRDLDDLLAAVDEAAVGDRIPVTLSRDGETRVVDLGLVAGR